MTVSFATLPSSSAKTGEPASTRNRFGSSSLQRSRLDEMSQASTSSGTSQLRAYFPLIPTSLKFVVDDPKTYKQVLTLFNLYPVKIEYKIQATTASKFHIHESRGLLGASCRKDILVRLVDTSNTSLGDEKIRFQMFDLSTPLVSILGQQEVPIRITRKEDEQEEEPSAPLLPKESARRSDSVAEPAATQAESKEDLLPSILMFVVAAWCVAVLSLPRTGESQGSGVLDLSVSSNLQLVCSFILGCLMMVVMRR